MDMAVTTNGWGAVNAAPYDVVNSSIQKQKCLPDGFTFTCSGSLFAMNINCTVSGTEDNTETPCKWKEWKLIPGGSGQIVYMTCVVENAYAHIQMSNNAQSKVYNISGSNIELSLNLKAVADASYNIKGCSGTAFKIIADEDQAVQVLDSTIFSNLDKDSDKILIDLLKDGFTTYLNNHLSDFSAAFSVVMIGGEIAKAQEDFQWMLPTDVSYAVEQTNDGQNYFGVLTMIDNDKITSQSQQLDTRAFIKIPEGANSVLILSAEKFCKHILLPSAVNVITGSTKADFEISQDSLSITNNKDLQWDKFQLSDGSVVQPTLPKGSFDIHVESTYIVIEIVGMRYSPSNGITVVTNLTQKVQIDMVKKSDGTLALSVDPKSAYNYSTINSSVEVAEWLKITEIILEATTAIASIACGVGMLGEKIAAKAVTTAVEGATAEVEMSASAISEAVEESGAEVESAISGAAAEVSAGAAIKTTGFFASNYVKILEAISGIIAGVSGVSCAIVELTKYIEQEQFDNLPSLNDFAQILLGNYAWPNLEDAKIINAKLSDSLLIYTNIL